MNRPSSGNDHVPLEFLLGARTAQYHGNLPVLRRSMSETQRSVLPNTLHVHIREAQARAMLHQVLHVDDRQSRSVKVASPKQVTSEERSRRTEELQQILIRTQQEDEEPLSNPNSIHQLIDYDQRFTCAEYHGYHSAPNFLDIKGKHARIQRISSVVDIYETDKRTRRKIEKNRQHHRLALQQHLQDQQEVLRRKQKNRE